MDKLRIKYQRLDEVWASVNWLLVINPYLGNLVPDETKHRIFLSDPMGNTPSFRFVYRLDEKQGKLFFILLEAID
ncbi:MAG: hypothetical protein ACRENZ_10890 [Thermodesulfobacteriota bacterium]